MSKSLIQISKTASKMSKIRHMPTKEIYTMVGVRGTLMEMELMNINFLLFRVAPAATTAISSLWATTATGGVLRCMIVTTLAPTS